MNKRTDLSLQHLIRPASEPNAPLLLLLHGYGSNEADLFSFAPELSSRYFIVSARAPFHMPPDGAAWYAINFDASGGKFSDEVQARESMELLMKFINELAACYPVNPNDINLIGFSQGAILAFALSLSYPHLFNKIVAMSGYINEELILDKGDLKARFSKNAQETKTTKIPSYFISHGTMDMVVPYSWGAKAPSFLSAINAPYIFKDYPMGHGVSMDNFVDMKKWLAS